MDLLVTIPIDKTYFNTVKINLSRIQKGHSCSEQEFSLI